MKSGPMRSTAEWLLLTIQMAAMLHSRDKPLTTTGDWHEISCSLAGGADASALELQGCQALFPPASLAQGDKLQVSCVSKS